MWTVRAYRGSEEIASEFCVTEEGAISVMDKWAKLMGIDLVKHSTRRVFSGYEHSLSWEARVDLAWVDLAWTLMRVVAEVG